MARGEKDVKSKCSPREEGESAGGEGGKKFPKKKGETDLPTIEIS